MVPKNETCTPGDASFHSLIKLINSNPKGNIYLLTCRVSQPTRTVRKCLATANEPRTERGGTARPGDATTPAPTFQPPRHAHAAPTQPGAAGPPGVRSRPATPRSPASALLLSPRPPTAYDIYRIARRFDRDRIRSIN